MVRFRIRASSLQTPLEADSQPLSGRLVERTEEWRYSSARNYLGEPEMFEVATEWQHGGGTTFRIDALPSSPCERGRRGHLLDRRI